MCPDYLDAETSPQHGCPPSLSTSPHPSLQPGVQVCPWGKEGVDPGSCQGRGSQSRRGSLGIPKEAIVGLFANLNDIQAGCPEPEAPVRELPLGPLRTELWSSSLSSQTQSPPQSKHSPDGHTTTSTRSTSPFIKKNTYKSTHALPSQTGTQPRIQ